jgi:pSer/pThr/pTyr-binding forkhead associated (FHA) protein
MKKSQVFKIEFKNGGMTQSHFVDGSSFILGRGESSAIQIDDVNVSREHLKIFMDDAIGICIQDLGSANGTFLKNKKIESKVSVPLASNELIVLGKSKVSLRVSLFSVEKKTDEFIKNLSDEKKINEVKVEISGYPESDKDIKLDFKNVGLDLGKYKDANEHSIEIIKEAEYIKHGILTNAQAQKEKILNETREKSKKIAEQTYQQYLKSAQNLLQETKKAVEHLRVETATELDQKKIDAHHEIDVLWQKHDEAVQIEKNKLLQTLKIENENQLQLELEAQRNTLFLEKEKARRDSDLDIEVKTKKYRAQFEIEQGEHQEKIRFFKLQIENLEKSRDELIAANSALQLAKSDEESQIDELQSQIKILTEQCEHVQKQFANLDIEYKEKIITLENFKKNRDELAIEVGHRNTEAEALSKNLSNLHQKKNDVEAEIIKLNENLSQIQAKNKLDIDLEFAQLREAEKKKFDGFKLQELKELQKIREQHFESVNKLSVDLSQEITTTLELEAKKANSNSFNFEKSFELINSIIQVKSSAVAGSAPKHQLQLDNWRKRQQMEKTRLMFSGFAAAFVFYFAGHYVYNKLTQDSFQKDMEQITSERQKKERENMYVPDKTAALYDDYVKSTIYTENFSDVYLNETYQQEWVRLATKHFLNKWKVSEEDTIKVISNSKALVQNIQEEIPKLKKDRIKSDLEKLTQVEKDNTDIQAKILGTYVKYEDYRKLEKSFFSKKLKQRSLANEKE